MKRKYGFMILLMGLVVGLAFCFSSGVRGVARAAGVEQMCKIYVEGGSYTYSGGTLAGIQGSPGVGVYVNSESTFTMDGGEMVDFFYGVALRENSDFYMNDGKISNNMVGVMVPVDVTGVEFSMKNGSISDNNGVGGVMINAGSFTMSGGTISNNYGQLVGGVRVDAGSFYMKNGTISNNTSGSGTGVCVGGGGSFIMDDGNITGNKMADMGGGYVGSGGGVLVVDGTFTMNGGSIKENFAYDGGGGVCVSGGTFTMNGGEIGSNTATYGSAIEVSSGTFKYAGGTIDGEIALNSSATFIISKEPETPFDINFTSDPTDGKIAKLEGIDTIDLTKINLTSHPDAKLSIREIDGEKWVVIANTYTVTVVGGHFAVVIGKYENYDSIPKNEVVNKLELQVPEGTIMKRISSLIYQIGETYITIVDAPYGYSFIACSFYDENGDDIRWQGDSYVINSNIEIYPWGEQGADRPELNFLPNDNHPTHKEKSNEYYVENKKTTIKSERKSKI